MSESNHISFIDRESTNVIKGVALVFMFIHHFFTIPSYYVEGISYPELSGFAELFKYPFEICIPIFAFLTGYFYWYAKNKTYRYSIKKCSDIWVNYLFTFALLLIPAIALGVYDWSPVNFFAEVFILYRPVMYFCWYVMFYITAMLILPLFAKLAKNHIVPAVALSFLIPALFSPIIVGFIPEKLDNLEFIFEKLKWFPCVACGFVFARYDLFRFFRIECVHKRIGARILYDLVLMSIPFWTKYFTSTADFIGAPTFVFGLVDLCGMIKHKKLLVPLKLIGKYSLSMWFVHGLFFNVCAPYTQKLLYWPKHPALVTLWGLLICLIVSYLIMIPINFINKQKNKLLKL
ncbi:MAG: acyltransferase [Clostridia bacterium]|nr:acyltransferase [Clostridia bacterium]